MNKERFKKERDAYKAVLQELEDIIKNSGLTNAVALHSMIYDLKKKHGVE
jgi:hypothetical protein